MITAIPGLKDLQKIAETFERLGRSIDALVIEMRRYNDRAERELTPVPVFPLPWGESKTT